MIQDATLAPPLASDIQIRLRWRLLIYFTIWAVAAAILAIRSDLYLADDSTESSARLLVFVGAPLVAAMGLDFAVLSAMHQDGSQVGVFMWLFVIAFVSHGLFTFSCARRGSFLALISILIITLSISVFYALRYFHLDATTGHG